MKDLFRIGEVAKLLNIKITTLRFYDESGLLKPYYTDESSGYRYYTAEQFQQLNTIKYLKALDVPLGDIKNHLSQHNIADILELLKKQQQKTNKKILELENINNKIANRISLIDYALEKRNELGIIKQRNLPCRKCVVLKRKIYPGDDLEIPIRKLENSVNLENSVFLGKIGLFISKSKLQNFNFKEYDSIFLLLEGDEVDSKTAKTIPSGEYLTLCFKGKHEEASPYYQKLLDYIEQNDMEILGDSLEITLIDDGLTNDIEQYVTEIQIMVKKH